MSCCDGVHASSMKRRIPDLIRELFLIDAAKDSEYLKNKASSFVRNGLLPVEREAFDEGRVRQQVFITDERGVTILYNALLLNAFFTDPKYVKGIFDNTKTRRAAAEKIKAVFTGRQSVLGIALVKPDALELLHCLQDTQGFNLRETRLPSPFDRHPLAGLGRNLKLMEVLRAQSASLDTSDSLMAAYLAQDWEKAYQISQELERSCVASEGVRSLIESVKLRYSEAQEFDDLITWFKER